MEPYTIIKKGITNKIAPDTIYKWVAVRGYSREWAIYYENPKLEYEVVRRFGNKLVTEDIIKDLVKCDDEAFANYRP